MPSIKLPRVTTGGGDYVERLVNVIAAAFAGDPLNRAVILYSDSLPNDAKIRHERRVEHFLPSTLSKASSRAILVEAGNWAAAALWFPPGLERPLPLVPLGSPLNEYFEKLGQVKKRHLGDRQYWYLNLLGRHPDRTEPGAIRALLDPYLEQAQKASLPAWLEATNKHAQDVYRHFGFKVAEEFVIGKGNIDERGNIVSGGEGVTIYGMIAEPRT